MLKSKFLSVNRIKPLQIYQRMMGSLPLINTPPGRFAICSIVSFISLIVYVDALSHDLVWDTLFEIQSPWIRDIKYLPNLFFSRSLDWTPNAGTPIYGPSSGILRQIQYSLFATAPWGYHLTNILLHGLSTIMVFLITGTLFKKLYFEDSALFPMAASLLFAVHPVHTEAVNWASSVAELNMSLFCLISLHLYTKADTVKYHNFVISGVLYFIALLFKVTALFWFPVFIVYEYSIRQSAGNFHFNNRTFWKVMFKRYIPYSLAVIAYLLLRTHAMGGLVPQKGKTALGAWDAVINIFPLFTQYLKLLVLPTNLNALYVFHPFTSFSDKTVMIAVLLTGLFMAFLVIAARKNPGLFFCSFCIVMPLIPCLYLPAAGFSYYAFAERYLYLPSAGFATGVSIILRIIYFKKPLKKMTTPLLVFIFCVTVAAWMFMTVERSHVWRNSFNLWSDTVKKSPDSPIAHNNLGAEYYRRGQLGLAMKEFEIAVSLDKFYYDAQINLINLKKRGITY